MHRGTVITIGVIAAVAALVYFYVEKRSYHDYEILQTSEQEDVVSTGYEEMANGILRTLFCPDIIMGGSCALARITG